jgi:hypothetical protein
VMHCKKNLWDSLHNNFDRLNFSAAKTSRVARTRYVSATALLTRPVQ